MKFYESHYEEYIESIKKYNLHPELEPFINKLPEDKSQMGNLIVYGPSGVGKYSQVLKMLKKYSKTNLKYDKKIQIQMEKQNYTYHISDVHFEIDMSLLGCNSKILWNEIFLQIIDIISVKTEKIGFIVCKNFHMIHSELLEIFYSYIQQYSKGYYNTCIGYNIIIHFILITENISFIPNNILNACYTVNIKRPTKEAYKSLLYNNMNNTADKIIENIKNVEMNEIMNIKELYSFGMIKNDNIPKDLFNIICDNIIKEIINPKKVSFTNFRDIIYDILIYNLEAIDCIWYILYYFINSNKKQNTPYLTKKDISEILEKSFTFLKYYNNNYRPIYHLESILFYIIIKIHKYEL